MNSTDYPRVLIIGQTFSGISGASITLRNLFYGWPKDRIALASNNINEFDENTFNYCINNYRLGSNEIKVLRPFNKFLSLQESKVIKEQSVEKRVNLASKKHSKVKLIVKKFLILTGINSIRFKYALSESFLAWYKEFNPQIVYSAAGDLDLIRFLLKIKQVDNVPIALHIWDDWPNTLADRTLLKKYWQNKINKEFTYLIKKSEKLLSISEIMSIEYKKRYKLEFIPFHNPINIEEWRVQDNLIEKTEPKIVLYVGKINRDTFELLKLMSETLQLIDLKKQFNFYIYSPDKGNKYDKFNTYDNVKVFQAVPHEQVVSVIQEADILFLPLGFSEKSIKYTRLSMPTKASEYMISGVPIIVMAPPDIALTKYALEYKWAEVVDTKDINKLKKAILKIGSFNSFVENITVNAVNLAKERHDAIKVRNEFRLALQESARYE